MERTTSRPPPGGGADWAAFFAPLAVTGVVILGALIFFWSSDPEPVDRPEVDRVDLSEVAPAAELSRFSSVPTTRYSENGSEVEAPPRVATRRLEHASLPPAPPPDVAPAADLEDDFDDDEDFVDMTSDREYTPEQRREAKAGLIDAVKKVPFMAPMMERAERKQAEAAVESAGQDGSSERPDASDQEAPLGAAGAGAQ